METLEFILDRARATRSAQNSIAATWTWPEKLVADWDTDIAAVETQKAAAADAEAQVDLQRGDLDEQLDLLHDRTVQWGTFLRSTNRNNRARTRALRALSGQGKSRHNILDEAQVLESMWRKVDPVWVPVPTQTLALFKTFRELCITNMATYSDTKSEWRIETEETQELSEELNEDCMAWYEAATAMFPEGTAEGDMIRGTVPTTTDFVPLPEQAEIALDDTGPGRYSVSLGGERATKFDVFHKFVDGPDGFVLVGEDVPPGLFEITGLAAGSYEVYAVPKNSRGSGPQSETVGLTVV
jgi:hypothetical protein